MDLLPSVDQLRDHLVAHDRAVREIIALDNYIEQMSERTFLSSMGESMHSTFKNMIRISVAEGLKRMYKEYRLKKWLMVQEMANTVRRVLDGEEPVSEPHQGQLVQQGHFVHPEQHLHQYPWQQQNFGMQMAAPEVQNWHPAHVNNQTGFPVAGPYPIISPIHTPSRMENTLGPQRHLTGATPEEFHQFAIANISASDNHLTSRRLFPEELASDMGNESVIDIKECAPSDSDSGHGDDEDNSCDESAHENSLVLTVSSAIPSQIASGNIVFVNQSVINPMAPQQEVNQHELLEDMDEMEWDNESDEEEDSFEYNSSEDSLAGVLFAAEHLLPEQQAVRLDVEMGDMGIGHMVFDRVSATWYTAQCEFYRGC